MLSKDDKIELADSWAVLHRPTLWKHMIGQEKAVSVCQGLIAKKKVPRTWLIVGNSSAGKTTMARILAAKISGWKGDPRINPDLHEINAATDGKVDDIRKMLTRDIPILPTGNAAVWMLDEAHALTQQAASALLKPLEEPPAHVMWIIATNEPQKMLETVRNRAIKVALEPYTKESTVNILKMVAKRENVKMKDSRFEQIAEASGYVPRDAISMLQIVDGLLKSGKDPKEAIETAYMTLEKYGAEYIAGTALFAAYTGDLDMLTRAFLGAENVSVIPTMVELNSFMFSVKSGHKTYWSPVRKQLHEQIKEKGLPSLKKVAEIQSLLVQARQLTIASGIKEHHVLSGLFLNKLAKEK